VCDVGALTLDGGSYLRLLVNMVWKDKWAKPTGGQGNKYSKMQSDFKQISSIETWLTITNLIALTPSRSSDDWRWVRNS